MVAWEDAGEAAVEIEAIVRPVRWATLDKNEAETACLAIAQKWFLSLSCLFWFDIVCFVWIVDVFVARSWQCEEGLRANAMRMWRKWNQLRKQSRRAILFWLWLCWRWILFCFCTRDSDCRWDLPCLYDGKSPPCLSYTQLFLFLFCLFLSREAISLTKEVKSWSDFTKYLRNSLDSFHLKSRTKVRSVYAVISIYLKAPLRIVNSCTS